MKNNQRDLLDMFRRVYKYVKTLTILISGTRPGLIAAIDKLKSKSIDKIDEMVQKQNEEIKGFTANKAEKRGTLDTKLYHVIAGTFAYASSIDDLILKGKMKYSFTDIQNISDETIVSKANDIITIVNPLIAIVALNDMGVDTTSITELEDARDAYADTESDPQEMIELRKSYTETLHPLVDLGRTILKDEADKAADTLKQTQKEWWNGYHNERTIISTGHRHNIIEGTIFSDVDVAPVGGGTGSKKGLYGCTVVATHESGKVYTVKADEDGHYKFVKILPGIFSSIKFTLEGYLDFELNAFRVKRGHPVINKDVFMKKN